MKKSIAVLLILVCISGLFGCADDSSKADYPTAIMVDDVLYYMETEPIITVLHKNEWYLCVPKE